MKANWVNIVWGIVLVLAGGLFLAQNLGWIGMLTLPFWMIVFAVVSLFFFVTYFAKGVREWGWLLPACIFGGVAITMGLANAGFDEPWIGTPILIGNGLPFLVVFLLDRSRNWWALIPAWTLGVIVAILFLVDRVPEEWIGTLVMWGIGLPFLVVYLTDRSRWWALIPGGVLIGIGFIPLLGAYGGENLVGALVMWLISAPFFGVYFVRRENWWAFIPAGILATIGLTILLAGGREDAELAGWLNGILFVGFGLTFAILWLRRASVPTAWARYPALILLGIGVLALVLGQRTQPFVLPVALILLGIWILINSQRSRHPVE